MKNLIQNRIFQITAALILGSSIGYFSNHSKVETKEVEKIIYIEKQSQEQNRDQKITRKKTKTPDGTIVTETTVENKESNKSSKESVLVSEHSKETKITSRPDYRIGLIYKPLLPNQNQEYQIMFEKRIFGEIYLGLSGSSNKTFGISVGIGF